MDQSHNCAVERVATCLDRINCESLLSKSPVADSTAADLSGTVSIEKIGNSQDRWRIALFARNHVHSLSDYAGGRSWQ